MGLRWLVYKPSLENNPELACTDADKAEVFINYFSSVFTTEPDSDELPAFPERDYQDILENISITTEMINKKLKNLKVNKSPGLDSIHPRVLHEVAEAISTPLTFI